MAFYGIYDTGNIAVVKNVKLIPSTVVTSSTKVTTSSNHVLFASWTQNTSNQSVDEQSNIVATSTKVDICLEDKKQIIK